MIYNVIGTMGMGKTLFATLYAIDYVERNPNGKIYANYSLKNLKNFIYTPFLILPFSEIENALIIVDDYYAVKNIKGLIAIVVNLSRKRNIDIVLTAQRDIMIDKTLRILSREIRPMLNQEKTILAVFEKISEDMQKLIGYVKNPLEIASAYYDTKEVVKFATKDSIYRDLSKLKDQDKITNIEFIFTNKKERTEALKYFGLDL